MSEEHSEFGRHCLALVQSAPFGSLGKRELELGLLLAGIESGLLPREPAALAAHLQLSLSKAHAYLTDLALRQPPLADIDAVNGLVDSLSRCEAVASDKHLSIPLHDAALRIWLERKLATERLHLGGSLRPDLIKLTPLGLLCLLDQADDVATPAQTITALGEVLNKPAWIKDGEATWNPRTRWREALSTFDSAARLMQGLPVLFGVTLGM